VDAPTPSPFPSPPQLDQKLDALEAKVTHLKRELERMKRMVALMEHDLAIQRITRSRSGVLGRLMARLSRWLDAGH
jgi:hypothetical protein